MKKFIGKSKNTLYNRNWDNIKKSEDPNKAYKYFLDIFIDIYDILLAKAEVKVKFKSGQSPIEKSSEPYCKDLMKNS